MYIAIQEAEKSKINYKFLQIKVKCNSPDTLATKGNSTVLKKFCTGM